MPPRPSSSSLLVDDVHGAAAAAAEIDDELSAIQQHNNVEDDDDDDEVEPLVVGSVIRGDDAGRDRNSKKKKKNSKSNTEVDGDAGRRAPFRKQRGGTGNAGGNGGGNGGSNNHSSSHGREAPPCASQSAAALAAAADEAREEHDLFNIAALLFVIFTTLSNWDFTLFFKGYGPAGAWTGAHFYLNWMTTVIYFIVDLIWVAKVPICVKSPDVIIKHHIVAIAYLSAPVAFPKYRWFMGACLTVEINTWFLIIRRVVFKRSEYIPFSDVLQQIIAFCFYVSWIIIRCIIYPAILVIFFHLAQERIEESGRFWHWPMVFIPVHFCLCLLNFKWSYDLFLPFFQQWFSILRGVSCKEGGVSTISNGL